jgi:Transmembrane secretion effector
VGDRVDQFRALVRQALHGLFDQSQPFGRLALVQVLMLAGDTLVTISLAGSLFFSISPTEAKSKVLLYLLLTLAPFAVVSPLLGPLIDRSRGARRLMVVFSAVGRATLCPFMARDIHSLLLFPMAFLILVLSKLYLVTRGALVPEMLALTPPPAGPSARPAGEAADTEPLPPLTYSESIGWTSQPEIAQPETGRPEPGQPEGAKAPRGVDGAVRSGYAAINARLTLLGTLAGFVASIPGIAILKPVAAAAWFRLPIPKPGRRGASVTVAAADVSARHAAPARPGAGDPDLVRLQPVAHPEVLLGLSANSLLRGLAGFLIFLLAFGLRRMHAHLYWYGLALGASGVGALAGLLCIPRLRSRFIEQHILTGAIALVAAAAVAAAWWGTLFAQVMLAFFVGVAGSLGQPSFDAMTQRLVPLEVQGRAFARFATRQQLVWVAGALIPVAVAIPLVTGDVIMAAVSALGVVLYVLSRRALHRRALPGHG